MVRSSYDELVIKEKIRIEQYGLPLGIVWYQPEGSKESFLLTANNQWKYKLYNSKTKMCRKTILGPTFGSFITKYNIINHEFMGIVKPKTIWATKHARFS